MTDKSDEYRQSLRTEIRHRRVIHKHYSPEQIEQFKAARRKELEDEIVLNKEELRRTKPSSLLSKIGKGIVNKIIPRRS
jgi:hypothetical protein